MYADIKYSCGSFILPAQLATSKALNTILF